MKTNTKILRWIGAAFFAIMSFGSLLSGGKGIIAAILFLLGGLLTAPLPFIDQFRQKLKLNKIISISLPIIILIIGFSLMPNSATTETKKDDTSSISSDNSENTSTDISSNTNASTISASTTTSSAEVESSNTDSTPSTSSPSVPSTSTENQTHTHSFSPATCTSPKTCSECGETNGKATGHKWIAATYSAPKTCSICGDTKGSPLTVPNSENYHGHVYTGGSSSKKYHYEAKCPGKNSNEITWDDVSKRKLEPCGTCVLK